MPNTPRQENQERDKVKKQSLSYLLAGGDVLGELDLGEVPLADGLEEAVLADLLRAGAGRRHPR